MSSFHPVFRGKYYILNISLLWSLFEAFNFYNLSRGMYFKNIAFYIHALKPLAKVFWLIPSHRWDLFHCGRGGALLAWPTTAASLQITMEIHISNWTHKFQKRSGLDAKADLELYKSNRVCSVVANLCTVRYRSQLVYRPGIVANLYTVRYSSQLVYRPGIVTNLCTVQV
jgi:hypothetical protein